MSVVAPVYRNAESLEELHRRLVAVLSALGRPFELVFVDDASPDDSGLVLRRLADADARVRVRVLTLARNEGQHRAVLRGLAAASGDPAIVLDSDLQDPPEAIPSLLGPVYQPLATVFLLACFSLTLDWSTRAARVSRPLVLAAAAAALAFASKHNVGMLALAAMLGSVAFGVPGSPRARAARAAAVVGVFSVVSTALLAPILLTGGRRSSWTTASPARAGT